MGTSAVVASEDTRDDIAMRISTTAPPPLARTTGHASTASTATSVYVRPGGPDTIVPKILMIVRRILATMKGAAGTKRMTSNATASTDGKEKSVYQGAVSVMG